MKIAILMSTYNGEKYVREQIDSILVQKGIRLELYVRDDGSSDSTTEILREYELNHSNVHFLNKDQIENIGIKDSFLLLLEYAAQFPENEYFAFADQDDVWTEDKIEVAVQMLLQQPNNPKGKLYYSNKTFVDKQLNVIRTENIIYYGDFYEVLLRSLASGCTMVFDRNLAMLAVRHHPISPIIHDSWVYHVAKCIGSTVVFEKDSHILYRQHGDNTIGMEGAQIFHNSISYWMKRFLPVLFLKREYIKIQFINEVYENYCDEMPEENREIAQLFLSYRRNFAAKLRLINNRYIKKRDMRSRAVWAYSIIFNRL